MIGLIIVIGSIFLLLFIFIIMNIKNFLKLSLLLLIIIIVISGCSNEDSFLNFNSEKYVKLYDYSSESIDYEYTQITYEDVQSIILTELSVNEAYIEVENKELPEIDDIVLISIDGIEEFYLISGEKESESLEKILINTKVGESIKNEEIGLISVHGIYRNAEIDDTEFILDYYGYKNFKELESFIRNRASEEIIFNEIFERISDNSEVVSYPEEIQKQINIEINSSKALIEKEYLCFEDFLEEKQISEYEFENQISSNFYDLMLYKAILDNEGLSVNKSDIKKYIEDNSISEEYSYYDVYKQISYEKVRKLLISKTNIIK